MQAFLRSRWVLLVGLCVFIVIKIPHLSYPYYWDESWPYAKAIRAMYDHGVSLMPDAIDGEISRGHPLFFHAIAAGWMKLFGHSHIAMHSFALLITVLFLIAIYEAGIRLFNQRVAVMAFLLIASQEVFFMQSSFVLFEMLVAFLCFMALWCYAKDKYFLTAVFLAMLFYTKESGLIMGFVLGADALVRVFSKGEPYKTKIYRLLAIGASCILIGVFFLLQKHIRGWYIFPFYSQIIEHSWNTIWYKFRMSCVSDAFYRNQKFFYWLLVALLGIIAAIKNRKWSYLAILVPVVLVFYLVDDKRAGRVMPSELLASLFVVSWFSVLFVLSRSDIFRTAHQRRFFMLSGCFIMCFLWFSTMNYYTYRYLLAVIVPALFIAAVLLDAFIASIHNVIYYISIGGIAVLSYFAFTLNDHFGDTDRGAFDAMDMQQDVVDYLERNNYYDKKIAVTSWVESQHLVDAATGFLKGDKVFRNVKWEIDGNTDIVIFDNIEADYRYEQVKKDTTFSRVHRSQKGVVWTELYMRK